MEDDGSITFEKANRVASQGVPGVSRKNYKEESLNTIDQQKLLRPANADMMQRVRGTKKWSQLHKSNPSIPPKDKGRDILISPDELEDCEDGTNELYPLSTPGNKDLLEFNTGQIITPSQRLGISHGLGDTHQTLKDELKAAKLQSLDDAQNLLDQ